MACSASSTQDSARISCGPEGAADFTADSVEDDDGVLLLL